jgi:hypothetical protein
MTMEAIDMSGLSAIMREAWDEAYARGMPLPWLLVTTGINGDTIVARYTEPQPGEGLQSLHLEEKRGTSSATTRAQRPGANII